jgi:hypothetical protein
LRDDQRHPDHAADQQLGRVRRAAAAHRQRAPGHQGDQHERQRDPQPEVPGADPVVAAAQHRLRLAADEQAGDPRGHHPDDGDAQRPWLDLTQVGMSHARAAQDQDDGVDGDRDDREMRRRPVELGEVQHAHDPARTRLTHT